MEFYLTKEWLREVWEGVCAYNPHCGYWIQTKWIKEQCSFLFGRILILEEDGTISDETTNRVIKELKRIGGVDGNYSNHRGLI